MATYKKKLRRRIRELFANNSGSKPTYDLQPLIFKLPFYTTVLAQQYRGKAFQRGIDQVKHDNADLKEEAGKNIHARYDSKLSDLNGIVADNDEKIKLLEEQSKRPDDELKKEVEARVKPGFDQKQHQVKEAQTKSQNEQKQEEQAIKELKCIIQAIVDKKNGYIPQSRYIGGSLKWQLPTILVVASVESMLSLKAMEALGSESFIVNGVLSVASGISMAVTGHSAGKGWATEQKALAIVSAFGCIAITSATITLRSYAPGFKDELILPFAALSTGIVLTSVAIAYGQNRVIDPQHSDYWSAIDKLEAHNKKLASLRGKTENFDKASQNIDAECEYEVTRNVNEMKANNREELAGRYALKASAEKQIQDIQNHIADEICIMNNQIDAAYSSGKQQSDI